MSGYLVEMHGKWLMAGYYFVLVFVPLSSAMAGNRLVLASNVRWAKILIVLYMCQIISADLPLLTDRETDKLQS